MSIFYVLPPRPLLGDLLAAYFGEWLPGMDWDSETRVNLAESLKAVATCQPDIFVVFREELPDGVATNKALVEGLGAEEGDEVIEVRALSPEKVQARRWQVRQAA